MIVLSAGHWPQQPNDIEHETCLDFAGCVAGFLPRFQRVLLPTTGLAQKIDEALSVPGAALYVEFHLNYGGGTGPECWHYPGDANGERAAREIQSQLEISWGGGRGIRPRSPAEAKHAQRLGWLRRLTPSVLVELCFRDRPSDLDKLEQVWHEYAVAAAFGVTRAAARIEDFVISGS